MEDQDDRLSTIVMSARADSPFALDGRRSFIDADVEREYRTRDRQHSLASHHDGYMARYTLDGYALATNTNTYVQEGP